MLAIAPTTNKKSNGNSTEVQYQRPIDKSTTNEVEVRQSIREVKDAYLFTVDTQQYRSESKMAATTIDNQQVTAKTDTKFPIKDRGQVPQRRTSAPQA